MGGAERHALGGSVARRAPIQNNRNPRVEGGDGHAVGTAEAVLDREHDGIRADQRLRRLGSRVGAAELEIDDQPVGNVDLPFFMLMMSSVGPSVGYDHGSAVSTRYASPFHFTGTLHEVVIQASPERFADVQAAGHAAEMGRQ